MYKRMIFMLGFVMFLAACGPRDYSPKEINSERDVCPICNMAIEYHQHATQIIYSNGDHAIFDDIGCMMEYYHQNNHEDFEMIYINDFETHDWIDAETAYYVHTSDVWTPMNYNVVGFALESDLEAFLEEHRDAVTMTFDEIKEFNFGGHHASH